MVDTAEQLAVVNVTSWSARGLAKEVKRLLVAENVSPQSIISITSARGGLLLGFIGIAPFSALVVFRR